MQNTGSRIDSSKSSIFTSRDDLIAAYHSLKEYIGRIPTEEDIDVYGKYPLSYYTEEWGNLDRFLQEIGEEKSISEELKNDLLKEYFEEREICGAEPTPQQIDEHGMFKVEDYIQAFGSWLSFLMYVEDLDRKQGINLKEKVSKDDLISAYYNMKQRLGHIPTFHEVNNSGKYGVDYYTYHYGSYDQFLRQINEKTTLKTSDAELVQNYHEVKKMLGRQPSSNDLRLYGRYSYQIYLKRYKSFNNFLTSIGEPIIRADYNVTKEILMEEYKKVEEKLGHKPSAEEINKNCKYHVSIFQKRFGSWLNFKKELEEEGSNRQT